MPKPHHTRVPELLTINQALEFIAYGDLKRARETRRIYISDRPFRSQSVLAYMDSEIMDALRILWRMFEEKVVIARDRGGLAPASRWAIDRLRQLAPGEELDLGPFVQELQRVAPYLRIPAAELMAALSEPAPVTAPLSFKALEAAYRGLSGKVRNKAEADKLVQGPDYFNQSIPKKMREEARKAAGFVGIIGAPRKK
jgi:hypothetical protein